MRMVLPRPAAGLPLALEVGAIPIVGHRRPNPGDEGEPERLGANRAERLALFPMSDELGRRRGGSPGGRRRRCPGAAGPSRCHSPWQADRTRRRSGSGTRGRPRRGARPAQPRSRAQARCVVAPPPAQDEDSPGLSPPERPLRIQEPHGAAATILMPAGCGGGRHRPQRERRKGRLARRGFRRRYLGGSEQLRRHFAAGLGGIVLKRSLACASAFLRIPGNSQLEDRSNSSAWWARSSLVQARRRALTLGSAQSASVVESSPSRCTRRTAKARQTSSYRRRGRQ